MLMLNLWMKMFLAWLLVDTVVAFGGVEVRC